MPIVSSDVKYYLSGGGSNTDPADSLGGAISSTQADSAITGNVSDGDASSGITKYRCVYVKNTHATLALSNLVVWLLRNTPRSDTVAAIGLGTSAIGGTEQTIADQETAPTDVTFVSAVDSESGLVIGHLDPGETVAIWIRLIVSSSAGPANDRFTISSRGISP